MRFIAPATIRKFEPDPNSGRLRETDAEWLQKTFRLNDCVLDVFISKFGLPPDAPKPTESWLTDRGEELHRRFKNGSSLAAWDALVTYGANRLPCPEWVIEFFQSNLDNYLRTGDVARLFGEPASRRADRHANELQFLKDLEWKAYVHAAYEIARIGGRTKEASYELAKLILERVPVEKRGLSSSNIKTIISSKNYEFARRLDRSTISGAINQCCMHYADIEPNLPKALLPRLN